MCLHLSSVSWISFPYPGRRKWQPTPVFLPGEPQGWGSLMGCHLWGRTELDTTEATQQQQQLSLWSNPHIIMANGKNTALTRQMFVGKVVSLLFNMLSMLVIAFLPRSKHILISWLQSPSAVSLEPPKIKVSHCFHCFPIYLP